MRGFFFRSCLLAIWLAFPVLTLAADAPAYSFRWSSNATPSAVEVLGVPQPTLQQLEATHWQSSDWAKLLAVYAGQGNFMTDMKVPPVLGRYRVDGKTIRFEPSFPFEPGISYRAVFRPSRMPGSGTQADIVSRFELQTPTRAPSTTVTQIFPSAEVLPENLLKFYVHFSAPMQGGHIYHHIHLRDETGKLVELPFLEIDEELWNLEMTRLTLFIDPGRIKRGVQPLEEIGPALESGKRYTLEIDAAWQDSAGLPLRESYRKTFRVGPQDREPPAPTSWKINSPAGGTLEALTVNFPEPMDHALALRVIGVADAHNQRVAGTANLTDQERCWSFTPANAWRSGSHQLQVQNTIEDLAGNNIGKAFEVDLFESVQRRFTNHVVRLSFKVL